MELTREELETVINYNESDANASVYTNRRSLIAKLTELSKTHPDDCEILRKSHDGKAIEFSVPKKWIKVSPPKARTYTDEQRKAAAERLALARERKSNLR